MISQQMAKRVHEDGPGVLPGPTPDRAARAHAAWPVAPGTVLPAAQFRSVFERECCLADRGTRRFSLLALCRRAGDRDERRGRSALADLARRTSQRVRSTDMVGWIDADRVHVLLTDTEPAGALVVATWVGQAAAALGFAVDQTIYVYPVVSEPNTSAAQGEPGRSATHGKAVHRPLDEPSVGALPAAVVPPVGGAAGSWPMADLWPLLAIPTPLWKRSLDVCLSAIGLLVLAPMFLLIALAVRLDSPGPLIFRHRRAGRGGRPFVFYKFRSMMPDAERQLAALASQNEIRKDPRVTRVGRVLRRWSLDELPQLWNVLKGDISLVGPRSPTLDEVGKYERWQRRRLHVIGGITCTWQVGGRSQIPFREWMRLDLRYVAGRNLWGDLRILALTMPAVMTGRGAC